MKISVQTGVLMAYHVRDAITKMFEADKPAIAEALHAKCQRCGKCGDIPLEDAQEIVKVVIEAIYMHFAECTRKEFNYVIEREQEEQLIDRLQLN